MSQKGEHVITAGMKSAAKNKLEQEIMENHIIFNRKSIINLLNLNGCTTAHNIVSPLENEVEQEKRNKREKRYFIYLMV